jgi:hypothetical protein
VAFEFASLKNCRMGRKKIAARAVYIIGAVRARQFCRNYIRKACKPAVFLLNWKIPVSLKLQTKIDTLALRAAQLALVWLLVTPLTGVAVVETARRSDSFVDSIGVNTHYGNAIFVGGNAYADRRIDTKLAELGVRHVRDHSWNDTALAIVDNLHATYRVRANLILGETSRSPADLVNLLKAQPGYEAIEGLNEPDFNPRSYNGFTDNPGANNYAATRAFQNDLYAAVKADPQTQAVQVLSPAMANSSRSQHLVPISFDVAAMHSYPSAREPTFGLDTSINQMATLRGNPPKPLMSTETGYYNNPVQLGWIPEHLSAKYIPRLHAEYFNRGIERTYLYELANQGPNPNEREQNFGLLRFDMSEKPAFIALENLIDLLQEPGAAAFAPAALDYTLTGSGAVGTLHHTLLQKSNGAFYLLLWNEVPVFNRFANNQQGSENINSPLAVTLTLNTEIAQARTYLPNHSPNPTATYENPSTISLNVPDHMLIVELAPPAAAIPEPATQGSVFIAVFTFSSRRRKRSIS